MRRFKLRNALFILPNAFTVSSIFCGMYAIWHGLTGNTPETLYESAIAVFFAGFFDLFDGRVARMTKTQSEFGVQLDSLADVVSFGIAPALLVYKWALEPMGAVGFLARFNVMAARDNGASDYFTGLPIPLAASVMIAALISHLKVFEGAAVKHPEWTMIWVLGLSLLMVSTVPYWTFKHYKFNRQTLMLGLLFVIGAWWFRLHYPTSLGLVSLLGIYILAGMVRFLFVKLYSTDKETR
jgi:CDP-diacylglycerol--serine O-phosphatidyltransferase